jgi:hypothetical protein
MLRIFRQLAVLSLGSGLQARKVRSKEGRTRHARGA